MSNSSIKTVVDCTSQSEQSCTKRLSARESILGEGLKIRRLLPHRQQRMIGAWCFFDHAGPIDVSQNDGLRVGPHPHTGLQTFSWMMDGEILHRDSLGYQQVLRKGEINLMTAGRGIVHSEESPAQRSAILQLAQLWIALPADKREIEPAFEHYADLPRFNLAAAEITVLVGQCMKHQSPVKVHSPLFGIDISSEQACQFTLPLQTDFEYGIAVLTGSASAAGEAINPGELLYLGLGRQSLNVELHEASQVILLGGQPFEDKILLYWNFLGSDMDQIRHFIQEWNYGDQDVFGEVTGYDGERILSPEL